MSNKVIQIFNNKNFILYFPSEGNLLRFYLNFYNFNIDISIKFINHNNPNNHHKQCQQKHFFAKTNQN